VAPNPEKESIVFNYSESSRSDWCIVQVDDHGSGWSSSPEGQPAPVQYCRVAEAATPLQKSLHRAGSVAPGSQIMVTAFEEYRHLWEPSLWFVRPERRFVCDNRAASLLSSAAAILAVAAHSPSNVITILPARCAVVHEWVLRRALKRASAELPNVTEGAITLGMIDPEEGIDEDYLVVGKARSGPGSCVEGYARRPVPWVARHLKHGGALVSSGIMIGYAGVFAAHVSKHWPGVAKKLAQVISAAAIAEEECEVPSSLNRGVPTAVLHSLRWHPPAFPQRVFEVCNSGWSGLKSARAIARVSQYRSSTTDATRLGSVGKSAKLSASGY
jgi:mannose-1-phosphate guanylyltransferase